jgi:hypothetical protein
MNMNVFAWIREGVRQSVLAGVSDAIEQMGTPADGEDLRPRLTEMLRRTSTTVDGTTSNESRPRRLGRSLKDFEAGKDK